MSSYFETGVLSVVLIFLAKSRIRSFQHCELCNFTRDPHFALFSCDFHKLFFRLPKNFNISKGTFWVQPNLSFEIWKVFLLRTWALALQFCTFFDVLCLLKWGRSRYYSMENLTIFALSILNIFLIYPLLNFTLFHYEYV